MSSLFWSFA
jgi:hypothetical protein